MISIKIERRNSGKTPWCQICGSEKSRAIYFSSGDERAIQSTVIHVCDDCAKDLIAKLNDSMENEKI